MSWKVVAAGAVLAVMLVAQVRLGAPPPELELRIVPQRPLEDFRGKKVVVILAAAAPEGTGKVAEELTHRGVEVLYAAPRAGASLIWLLDEEGILRRTGLLPASPQGIADFVKEWELGKKAFEWGCPRCHGENGHEGYEGARSLEGIGNRLSREQIRARLNASKIAPDLYSIRCCQFTGRELEALVVFVAGL